MRHVTRRILADSAADEIEKKYHLGVYSQEKVDINKKIAEEIRALGESPDPDEVNRIAGGNWTQPICDECGLPADESVEFDFELMCLCKKCLSEAFVLIGGSTST